MREGRYEPLPNEVTRYKALSSVSRLVLTSFSMNLLAFYHECRSLNGYVLVNYLTAASLSFRGVCEDDLDKLLND